MTTDAAPLRARVTPAELRRLLEDTTPARIIDVRTPAEFEATHIPASYNVPLDMLREHRNELTQHLDTDVVLVCRSGMRAEQAERAFAEAGLSNLHVLDGGIMRWESEGGTVNRGRQRWDIERQVRLVAGGIVLAAGLGSIAVPSLKWVGTAIGAGLFTAALTNTCAMGAALSKLPFNRGAASCDLHSIVSQLSRPTR